MSATFFSLFDPYYKEPINKNTIEQVKSKVIRFSNHNDIIPDTKREIKVFIFKDEKIELIKGKIG